MANPTPKSAGALAAVINGSAGITPALPAGFAAGDHAIAVVGRRTVTLTIPTPPTGWTLVAGPITNSAERMYVYERILQGGDTDPTFTWSSTSGDQYARIFTLQDEATSVAPIEVVGSGQNGTTSNPTLTGITTLTDGSLVCVAMFYGDDNNTAFALTSTDPATYTEQYAEATTGADGTICFSTATRTTAGATGNIAHAGLTVTAGDGWVAVVFAVIPEPVGDTPINAESGSYSTTGQTASTLYGRVSSDDPGSYAISGQSATTAHGRLLSADPGSYAIAGVAATTTHASPNVVMVADPGSYDLTGVATTHLIGTVGQADPGTYSVTGQLAATLYGRVGQADPGTYGVTGFEATTLHGTPNVAITADPGSYAVAGSAIETLVGRVLAADAGSYALTGAEATTLYGRVLSADAGAYAFTGMSVTTAYSGDRPSAELFGLLHTQPKLSGATHTQSRLMGDPRTGPRYSGDPH